MTLGEFFRSIREYLLDSKTSDEDLVNDLLACVIKPGSIKKRNSDEMLYIKRDYANKIINNKASVPPSIVDALNRVGIQNEIKKYFIEYFEDYVDSSRVVLLIEKIQIGKADTNNTKDFTTIDFLFNVFISTLSVDNKLGCKSDYIIKKKGNSCLRVVEGDMFKFGFSTRKQGKNIVVIPVNTTFNTHISTKLENEQYPMISTQTIHGSWLWRLKNKQEKIEDIDIRIKNNLDCRGILPDSQGRYPIGTIATIDFSSACFYLLAVSEFDEYNHASSNVGYIKLATEKLINHYDLNGQGYDLYIPLIGTGLSRANLDYQESFELIKNSVLCREKQIYGKISIVIPKDVIDEIEIGGV